MLFCLKRNEKFAGKMKRRKYFPSTVENIMYKVWINENGVKEFAACSGVSFSKVDDIRIKRTIIYFFLYSFIVRSRDDQFGRLQLFCLYILPCNQ